MYPEGVETSGSNDNKKKMKRVQNIIPLSHIRYHGVDGTSGKRQSFMAFPNRSTTWCNLSEVGTNLEFHVDISISFIFCSALSSFSYPLASHSFVFAFSLHNGVTFLWYSLYFICNQGMLSYSRIQTRIKWSEWMNLEEHMWWHGLVIDISVFCLFVWNKVAHMEISQPKCKKHRRLYAECVSCFAALRSCMCMCVCVRMCVNVIDIGNNNFWLLVSYYFVLNIPTISLIGWLRLSGRRAIEQK